MTKEKTALVIPNAIQICAGSEKLFFCSFATRNHTLILNLRVSDPEENIKNPDPT